MDGRSGWSATSSAGWASCSPSQGGARRLHEALARTPAAKRRSLEPSDFGFLATLLAGAEAWRVYACQPRAFRLAGLGASPRPVSRIHASNPAHGPTHSPAPALRPSRSFCFAESLSAAVDRAASLAIAATRSHCSDRVAEGVSLHTGTIAFARGPRSSLSPNSPARASQCRCRG
jgi:hypothetical protein